MTGRFTGRPVAVVGYGQSPIVRRSDVALGPLTVATCLEAIADAGLPKDQIDGFTTGSILPSSGDHGTVDGVDIVTANWMAETLGIHPRWSSGFQGYGQLSGSVILAAQAIASGTCDYVLVHRALSNPAGKYHESAMTEARGGSQWSAPQGFWGPPLGIALSCNQYMSRSGATREDLANVVVSFRENGAEVPWSYWYRHPLSTDEYLSGRIIADPISIFDCDIPVTGATAFVLTTAERAADLPHRPVHVAGFAQGNPLGPTGPGMAWPLDDILEGGRRAGKMLWEHTGLTADDVDHPQLYDGFSPFVWYWLESLGFCGPGEAPAFIAERAKDLNMFHSGGNLGNGRMHGSPQMLDCYLQLSQRAGDRQLADKRVGLACQSSPHFGGVVVYSAEPV